MTTAGTTRKTVLKSERSAFAAGDKVEYERKLAKVIAFGYLEIATNPGQDAKFSEELEANLQLPAPAPGGKPDYAFHVPVSEIKSLKGRENDKRRRELEMEFNPLFGDPVPLAPAKEGDAPKIRQAGPAPKAKRTSSTRGKEAAAPKAAPTDMVKRGGEKTVTAKSGKAAK